jgi:hypothetical protein
LTSFLKVLLSPNENAQNKLQIIPKRQERSGVVSHFALAEGFIQCGIARAH